jgi:hypothetical protein
VTLRLVVEESFAKRRRIERLPIGQFVADSEKFNRSLEFVDAADDDSPRGSAINFSHDEPGEPKCLMKLLRLRHTVVADGGIQDEQDLIWSTFISSTRWRPICRTAPSMGNPRRAGAQYL